MENPYPYISKADIYVQPSRHEGYCLSLAEAKCLCKPIITTNFTGAKEQIINGHNGYIVNDEEDLYERIKFLIENPKERSILSEHLKLASVDNTLQGEKFMKYIV